MQGRWADARPVNTEITNRRSLHWAKLRISASVPIGWTAAALRAAQSLRNQPGEHGRGRIGRPDAPGCEEHQAAGRSVSHEHRRSRHRRVALPARLGHVHFVDSNRRPAGIGHLDYAPIAARIQEIATRLRLGRSTSLARSAGTPPPSRQSKRIGSGCADYFGSSNRQQPKSK